jgi:hypothetical protein
VHAPGFLSPVWGLARGRGWQVAARRHRLPPYPLFRVRTGTRLALGRALPARNHALQVARALAQGTASHGRDAGFPPVDSNLAVFEPS